MLDGDDDNDDTHIQHKATGRMSSRFEFKSCRRQARENQKHEDTTERRMSTCWERQFSQSEVQEPRLHIKAEGHKRRTPHAQSGVRGRQGVAQRGKTPNEAEP